jgi:hypothetical protein
MCLKYDDEGVNLINEVLFSYGLIIKVTSINYEAEMWFSISLYWDWVTIQEDP